MHLRVRLHTSRPQSTAGRMANRTQSNAQRRSTHQRGEFALLQGCFRFGCSEAAERDGQLHPKAGVDLSVAFTAVVTWSRPVSLVSTGSIQEQCLFRYAWNKGIVVIDCSLRDSSQVHAISVGPRRLRLTAGESCSGQLQTST